MLTPADIDTKRFSTTRLKEGYVQEEVDDFLDQVQEAYKVSATMVARLEEENRTLRRKLEAASSEAPTTSLPPIPSREAERPSAIVEKMLAAAEQAANEHEAEARAKADGIVRDAGAEGARLVEEASAAAERIKAEGLAEKYRRNEDLDRKASDLNAIIDDLNGRAGQVKSALTSALNAVNGIS